MITRKRTENKDRATLLYLLTFITLAAFTYGVERDMEFRQAALYIDYN